MLPSCRRGRKAFAECAFVHFPAHGDLANVGLAVSTGMTSGASWLEYITSTTLEVTTAVVGAEVTLWGPASSLSVCQPCKGRPWESMRRSVCAAG
jgi:hypothetical protein